VIRGLSISTGQRGNPRFIHSPRAKRIFHLPPMPNAGHRPFISTPVISSTKPRMASLRPRLFGLRARVRTIEGGNIAVGSLGIAAASSSYSGSKTSSIAASGGWRLASTAHAHATKTDRHEKNQKSVDEESSVHLKRTSSIDNTSPHSTVSNTTSERDSLAHLPKSRKKETTTSFSLGSEAEEDLVS
jgi:hypothetical protein